MASPPLESKARVTLELFFVCLGEKICQQVTLNSCNPQFEKLAIFSIRQIFAIFKEPDVLPRRPPNLGKTNIHVFLTN